MFVYIGLIMRQISCHPSKFYAYLSRLRWIKRWRLMRNAEPENVMEHSWELAVVAHDVSEVLTGDLPTPIKYCSNSLTTAYRQIEAIACTELINTLPEALQASYHVLLSDEQQPEIHHQIIKAADTLSAYLKCLSELRAGNLEFSVTASELEKKLKESSLPEVDYFMQSFIPAFVLPLDGSLKSRSGRALSA
jgi:5'-deoxynucleotidase